MILANARNGGKGTAEIACDLRRSSGGFPGAGTGLDLWIDTLVASLANLQACLTRNRVTMREHAI